MTCKAIEADSGIFTLGSKSCPLLSFLSILVETSSPFFFITS